MGYIPHNINFIISQIQLLKIRLSIVQSYSVQNSTMFDKQDL